MKDSVAKALNEADWEDMIPKLVAFAHKHMCHVLADFEHKPVINGYDPVALTQEAIKRTVMPEARQWDPNKGPLIKYLFWVIRSITDCEMKKHCKVELAHPTTDEEGKVSDPAENVPDDALTPDNATDAVLIAERQRAFLDSFTLTIEHDDELSALILAMMEGFMMPKEISEQTGIPANRVSDLKPKLRGKMEAFAGSNPIPLEKNIALMEI
jgi:hypothetical protein